MLDVGHLGDCVVGGHVAVVVVCVLRHRRPAPEQLPLAEQLIESLSKLARHRAVQDEVDRRVYQRKNVHQFTCNKQSRTMQVSYKLASFISLVIISSIRMVGLT